MSINTKCEKCVFKILDNNGTQIGCHFDVPTKMMSLSPIYSENQVIKTEQYWKINNFYCPYARIREWADIISENKEDIVEKIHTEIKMPYYLIVLINNIEDLILCIKQINISIYKPDFVSFIYNQKISGQHIKTLIENQSPKFMWKLHVSVIESSDIIDMANIAASTNLNPKHLLVSVCKSDDITVNTIDTASEVMTYCLNKKCIICKNTDWQKKTFDFIMFPQSLFIAANKDIRTVCELINNDINSNDLYIIDLS